MRRLGVKKSVKLILCLDFSTPDLSRNLRDKTGNVDWLHAMYKRYF